MELNLCQNSVDEIQCSCQFSVEYLVHEFSAWNSVHGIQCMEFSALNSVHGIQSMEFSAWNSVHGIQQVEFSLWNSAVGGIQMVQSN